MHNFRPWNPGLQHTRTGQGIPDVASARPFVVNRTETVHLPRRLGAMIYDALLLCAVLFIAGLPLPLIPEPLRFEPGVRYATLIYLLGVSFLFFGWFWVHGGQTLGMRAWRFRVVSAGDGGLGWKLAWRRFAWAMVSWAALGLGFIWSLVDTRRWAWHDRFSGTYLVRVAPESLAPQQQGAHPHEQQRR